MNPTIVNTAQSLPEPTYFNLEYIFFLIYKFVDAINFFLVSIGGINFLKNLISIIVILLIASIIYTIIRIKEIEKEEDEKLQEVISLDQKTTVKNIKWENVLKHISSNDPASWKVAVIDADSMLDELLIKMGYIGDSMGDRLMSINEDTFQYLNEAWEAHKVRNNIAHGGSDFVLNKQEAKRVIDNYELIFRTQKYI